MRCLPFHLIIQATLSRCGDCGASNAKRIAHGEKVSDSACRVPRENLVAACAGDAGALGKSVDSQVQTLQTLLEYS